MEPIFEGVVCHTKPFVSVIFMKVYTVQFKVIFCLFVSSIDNEKSLLQLHRDDWFEQPIFSVILGPISDKE